MAVRFNGKKAQNKFIRPIPNAWIRRTIAVAHSAEQTDEKVEEKVEETTEQVEKTASQRKAKKKNTENNMADKRIAQAQQVLDVNQLPKKQVRVEKKDKGLYERAENSVTLITEDNKMILND